MAHLHLSLKGEYFDQIKADWNVTVDLSLSRIQSELAQLKKIVPASGMPTGVAKLEPQVQELRASLAVDQMSE